MVAKPLEMSSSHGSTAGHSGIATSMWAPASTVTTVPGGAAAAASETTDCGTMPTGVDGTAASTSSIATAATAAPWPSAQSETTAVAIAATAAAGRAITSATTRSPKYVLSSMIHEPVRTTGAPYGHAAGISSTGSSPTPMIRSAACNNGDSIVASGGHPGAPRRPVGHHSSRPCRCTGPARAGDGRGRPTPRRFGTLRRRRDTAPTPTITTGRRARAHGDRGRAPARSAFEGLEGLDRVRDRPRQHSDRRRRAPALGAPPLPARRSCGAASGSRPSSAIDALLTAPMSTGLIESLVRHPRS